MKKPCGIMKGILLFVLAQSINESSLEYEDYHHNGLRLNFEDELNNNEDMRSSTVFPKTTNKVYLIGTNREESMLWLKHLSTQRSKMGKYEKASS